MTREEEIRKASQEFAQSIASIRPELNADSFRRGAEWADKTQIERVLNFIFEYFYEHPHVNAHICTDSFKSLEELEEELIKAMEE